jgi:hypothetical protein
MTWPGACRTSFGRPEQGRRPGRCTVPRRRSRSELSALRWLGETVIDGADLLRTVGAVVAALAFAVTVSGCNSSGGAGGRACGTLVCLDIAGGKTVRLRGDGVRCVLNSTKSGPSFYAVRGPGFESLGRGGFVILASPSNGIPGASGAFPPSPASVQLRVGSDQLVGGGDRGGRFKFSGDQRHVSVDVRLRRSGRGGPLPARLRGTITCTDRTLRTSLLDNG